MLTPRSSTPSVAARTKLGLASRCRTHRALGLIQSLVVVDSRSLTLRDRSARSTSVWTPQHDAKTCEGMRRDHWSDDACKIVQNKGRHALSVLLLVGIPNGSTTRGSPVQVQTRWAQRADSRITPPNPYHPRYHLAVAVFGLIYP